MRLIKTGKAASYGYSFSSRGVYNDAYSLCLLTPYNMYVGGAEFSASRMVFSKMMSAEDFSDFFKQEGLMEVDCKKLSGMCITIAVTFVSS